MKNCRQVAADIVGWVDGKKEGVVGGVTNPTKTPTGGEWRRAGNLLATEPRALSLIIPVHLYGWS